MFSLATPPVGVKPMSLPQNSDIIAGGYTQIPQKFYHPNAGRNALGLVGGNDVTLVAGNMVDLESELRGITRDLSKAPAKNYKPSCLLGEKEPDQGMSSTKLASINSSCPSWPTPMHFIERSTGKAIRIDTQPQHLPTVQMFTYPGVPMPDKLIIDQYNAYRF
jgi:hypothetical protein